MVHTISVGEVEILSLLDVGDWTLPRFFPSVPPDVWETYRALYPDALGDDNSMLTTATAYLLRTRELTVLVDTGLGPGPHERNGGQTGRLLIELGVAGMTPEDVDVVAISHLHRDHVGWNALITGGQTRATFPRARYLIPRADWEYFRQPAVLERSPHLEGTLALFDQGSIELVDGEQSVDGQITLVPTPGHTPGHQAVLVVSRGERALIVGDMVQSPAQVHETSWASAADVDPVQAHTTRGRVLDRVEEERMLLCAGHFPHPGFGHLVRLNGRRVFQAARPAAL